MKVLVTIEETISQSFEVEADSINEALEIAKDKYNAGEFVIESGNVTNKMIQGIAEGSEEGTEWVEF